MSGLTSARPFAPFEEMADSEMRLVLRMTTATHPFPSVFLAMVVYSCTARQDVALIVCFRPLVSVLRTYDLTGPSPATPGSLPRMTTATRQERCYFRCVA